MRKSDQELGRLRSHLTAVEVERLLDAAGKTENAVRDRTLILLMLRHALRLGEALDLRWEVDVDLGANTLFVRRLKSGTSGLHPLRDDELQALGELRTQSPESTFVFPSGRTGGRLSKSTINRLFERLGRELNLPVPLCPHMLRHTACTQLVRTNSLVTVQRFAGHASIYSTVRYVGMNPGEFDGVWKAA
jgi:integrase